MGQRKILPLSIQLFLFDLFHFWLRCVVQRMQEFRQWQVVAAFRYPLDQLF